MMNATTYRCRVELGAFTKGGDFKALQVGCDPQILLDLEDLVTPFPEKRW
jgi:hypothetical protein